MDGAEPTERDVIAWCLYPKVVEDYYKSREEHGYITRLGSHVYFHGLAVGETNKVNIEDGKTLVIKYLGLGDRNDDGTRVVQFELNGMRREVVVPDKNADQTKASVPMADPDNKMEIGSAIPGAIGKVLVKKNDKVTAGQVLAVIEAMKMETSVLAKADGTVDEVRVEVGDKVKAGELLITLR
jgi:pyruvate carboxylase